MHNARISLVFLLLWVFLPVACFQSEIYALTTGTACNNLRDICMHDFTGVSLMYNIPALLNPKACAGLAHGVFGVQPAREEDRIGSQHQEVLQDLMEKDAALKKYRTYLVVILFLLAIFGFLLFFEFRSRAAAAKTLTLVNEKLTAQQVKLTEAHDYLLESEAKYRSLVENSPTGILLLDRKGNILEVNKKMLDILGSPGPEETKGINCLDFPPLKAIGLSDDLLSCIESGEPISRKVFYITKWNREVHLNYHVTPLKKKTEVYNLILNAEDISGSVRAERLRLESELQYRILVENSLQAMLIVQGGKVIFANSKIEELTGYPVDEIKDAGRRWLNLLIHPDDKRQAFKNVREALDGKEVDARQTYKIIRKDGQNRYIETLGAVVDFHGKPAMLVVAIDITDNMLVQNRLVESEKRLRELNAMKDKFFSIIAHDLKNPFSSILGFSNLLNEAYDNFSEKQRKSFIKNICEASENTFKLLQNLLEWSRTQTGKIEFLPRLLNVENIVNENIGILNSGFLRKNISLQVNIPADVTVYADENMIKLVIRNLLANALKFTNPGGVVKVEANRTEGESVITVKDNGVGISKENLLLLFRIGDQVKTTGTANEKGSGLGLILSREFVEQNNGRIWVKSKVGEGTSFFVSLPAENPNS